MGCTSKKGQDLLNSYQKNIEYHKNLQQTESTELKSGENRVAMMTATYLFRATLDKNDTRDEVFIIAVQFEEENARMNFSTNSTSTSPAQTIVLLENNNTETKVFEDYSLTMKGIRAIKVERLSMGDKRLKNLSFLTAWSQYYQVTFPNIKSQMFSLSFSQKKYGTGLLTFSKVGKFVLTQKGF